MPKFNTIAVIFVVTPKRKDTYKINLNHELSTLN